MESIIDELEPWDVDIKRQVFMAPVLLLKNIQLP